MQKVLSLHAWQSIYAITILEVILAKDNDIIRVLGHSYVMSYNQLQQECGNGIQMGVFTMQNCSAALPTVFMARDIGH